MLKTCWTKLNIAVRMISAVIPMILVCLALTGCAGSDSSSLITQAFSQIEELEYRDALETFASARENGDDERLILRGEGIAYLGLGEYQNAIDALEGALAESNGFVTNMDYDINYYLATAYYKNGNTDEAIKIYDSILALKPQEVNALYLRGVLYANKEELDKAMESFDDAIKLAPDDYDMLIKIYAILNDNGYKEIGQEYLNHAMETGTKKMSNYEKGQISYYLEDYESARTYFEKAKDEEGPEAVLFLGKTYEILGDINYAVSVYSSYANAGEATPEILNEMGICKIKMEDYEGALSAFQQAMRVENNGMLQTLKFNEIVAYEYMGDFKKACVLMESYLRSYPDDEKAKREYVFLKTR